MTSFLATFTSLAPYHLLTWATLLGTQLYQSFVMTKLCFRHLPRAQFMTLQSHVFPAYFRLQTLLAALTLVTYPPLSFFSLARPAKGELWVVHVPLALQIAMAALNTIVWGPRTGDAMMARAQWQQEAARARSEGKSEAESGKEEAKLLDRRFSKCHAMSMHLNAVAMLATVVYGVGLAGKVRFEA